jgi:hypothetical protein
MWLIYSEQCDYCIFYRPGRYLKHIPDGCKNPKILSKRNNNEIYDDDGSHGEYARNYDKNGDCNLNCKYFVKREAKND